MDDGGFVVPAIDGELLPAENRGARADSVGDDCGAVIASGAEAEAVEEEDAAAVTDFVLVICGNLLCPCNAAARSSRLLTSGCALLSSAASSAAADSTPPPPPVGVGAACSSSNRRGAERRRTLMLLELEQTAVETVRRRSTRTGWRASLS